MDQISIDKKNVPLPLAPTTIQETRRAQRDHLLHALEAIGQMNNLKRPWMQWKKGNFHEEGQFMHWNIQLSSLFDHLNGKTSYKKIDPPSVIIDEKDVIVVAWI